MKTTILIFIVLTMASCYRDNSTEHKFEGFYFVKNCSHDTEFLKHPSFDTTNLTVITIRNFLGSTENSFKGQVIKLTNVPAPIDGGVIYYLTTDLGIIYSKSTTWPCYQRLHSTNDSIENRINQYLEHILLWTDLSSKGEFPPTGN